LLALNELRDEIEAGLQKRAEQLCTALKAAETAEWGLQRAIDSVGKMKNHLMSITVHNTDSSSLTKDLDKLKVHFMVSN
jgi:hypothetical protein